MPEDNRTSSARYDGEPDTGGDFTDEFAAIVYDDIMRRVNGQTDARLYDDGIMFVKYQLTLSCTVQRIGESHGNYSAEMLYILTHPTFDEPLCEYASGIGSTAEEAIINGAEQFTAAVLLSIFSAFDSVGECSIVSEFAGRTRTFKCSDDPAVYVIGADFGGEPDMFGYIKSELPDYFGSKNAYWIKLYAVCYDGKISGEVRINGAVMFELSEKLRRYAMNWRDKNSFHSEKQFVLLLDKEPSGDVNCAPPELVIDITKHAIDLFTDVTDDESERRACAKLKELCGMWTQLTAEMFALIPDLFTCVLLGVKQGDGLKLHIGDALVKLKRSQLRDFGYIEQGVIQYLAENQVPDELAYNVMCMGSVMDAVSTAVSNGAELERIGIKELTAFLPGNYELL
ncbi:hypothetical protein SAMN02910317_02378 [Ruminococcaceae bacterium FB2012]|nr:hypothetical protein SAMN02910317_02378 [Ruminococcaceae bacterium FB2012]